MKAIVAVDQNWAIGKSGQLLVHLPGDLQYFKEKTLQKAVVMGRTTLLTLPGGRPLKDRHNVVLSTDLSFRPACQIARSLEDLLSVLAAFDSDDIYVIGGEQVYRELLPLCDTVYVTIIEAVYEADKHFPNLDQMEEWEQTDLGEQREENGVTYRFATYRRHKDGGNIILNSVEGDGR